MSALYWPDFDCTPLSRAIEYPDTVHEHHATERAVCQAYRDMKHREGGGAYRCIRGPGGLVRGIVDHGRRLYAVRDGVEVWVPLHATHYLTEHGAVLA